MKKGIITSEVLFLFAVVFVIFNVFLVTSAFAATDVIPSNMENIGSSGSNTEVTAIVDNWVTNLRIIGIGLILIPIAISGIMLAFSMGNAQKRAIAVGALSMAAIGIIILAKMHSLAGWLAHQQ